MNKSIAAAAFCALAGSATASFNLQITELWMGNEPGSNLTVDWIEVTNFGDMAWTAATDGNLYFDDDSFNWENADLMDGIASIAPGETVVFIDGDALGVFEWTDIWSAAPAGLQVGTHTGSGLGQGGDGAGIFIDADLNGIDMLDALLDTEEYPDANLNGGQSWDAVLGEFSTVGNASGAFATTLLNDEGQNAIASPGTIPAPASAALLALGGLAARRRR